MATPTRQMTFSFQSHQPVNKAFQKPPKLVKQKQNLIEQFNVEISSLSKLTSTEIPLSKLRSKSTLDPTSIGPPKSPLFHEYQTIDSNQTTPFEDQRQLISFKPRESKDDLFDGIHIETSVQNDPRMDQIEKKIIELDQQKQYIKIELQHKVQQLQANLRMKEKECQELQSHVLLLTDKEKHYQMNIQQQNWQILQLREQINELNEFISQKNNLFERPIEDIRSLYLSNSRSRNLIERFWDEIQNGDTLENIRKVLEAIDQKKQNINKDDLLDLLKQEVDDLKRINKSILIDYESLKAQRITVPHKNEKQNLFEPEQLSTQESINFMEEIISKAIHSQEMMRAIGSNTGLMGLMEKIVQRVSKKDLSYQDPSGLFNQTYISHQNALRVAYQYQFKKDRQVIDDITTNKKTRIMMQRRNNSMNLL